MALTKLRSRLVRLERRPAPVAVSVLTTGLLNIFSSELAPPLAPTLPSVLAQLLGRTQLGAEEEEERPPPFPAERDAPGDMMLAIWLEADMAIGREEDEAGELEAASACRSAWYGMVIELGEEEAIEE